MKKVKLSADKLAEYQGFINALNDVFDDLLYKHPDINGFYIHGGLTFANGDKSFCPELSKHFPDYWIFGFDTRHADDTAEYWTEERTWEETEKLLQATIHYRK